MKTIRSRRAATRLRATLAAAVMLGGAVAGCGQRGPLVLPAPQARPQPAADQPGAAPAAPATRDQRKPAM
jgi:predicted small lipoprotein YifL